MIRDFTDMISAYFQVFTLASRYKLYPYLILSGIISLIIGGAIFTGAYAFSDDIGNFIKDVYPWEWGRSAVNVIAGWFSGILITIIGFFLYKYIILILVGPIMSPLSEKLEEGLSGDKSGIQFSWARMIKEMLRGIRIGLRNIFKEILYTILLLIASLIPGVAFLSTPGIYMVQAYYAGFGNMDFFLERHYDVKGSAQFVRKYGGAAVANGAIFLLILLIPVIGLILAPFMATIAATKVGYDRLLIEENYGYSY
jgi:CysZ protein